MGPIRHELSAHKNPHQSVPIYQGLFSALNLLQNPHQSLQIFAYKFYSAYLLWKACGGSNPCERALMLFGRSSTCSYFWPSQRFWLCIWTQTDSLFSPESESALCCFSFNGSLWVATLKSEHILCWKHSLWEDRKGLFFFSPDDCWAILTSLKVQLVSGQRELSWQLIDVPSEPCNVLVAEWTGVWGGISECQFPILHL